MPVRKVANHGHNIIGRFPSLKLGRMVDFESLIERDLIYLLDFDPAVTSFSEQPLTIEYEHEGQILHYTPDFHVVKADQNWLVECKPQQKVGTPKNQGKFRAGHRWCVSRRWQFEVVTDEQLRRGYGLANVRFLTQFARYSINPEVKHQIQSCLATTLGSLTITELSARVKPNCPQALKIPIYHLAFHHDLVLPLDDAPISNDTPVYLARRDQ
jgi:hypothetical protein